MPHLPSNRRFHGAAAHHPMTNIDREQIVSARRLCLELIPYLNRESVAVLLASHHRQSVGDLINQFERLVKAEERQNKARAKNAQKAGRPRKKRPSKAALATRKWREVKKANEQ